MKTRAMIRAGRRRRRRGFSLAEVMVAMTLLSIILMGLARVTFSMAAAGRGNETVAKRNAVLVQEANKFNAMQFSALSSVSTTERTFTFNGFQYTRRLSITLSNSNTRATIKIAIIPTREPTKKDSVFVYRTNPPGSPLCQGC